MSQQIVLTLSRGQKMPAIGLGTWQASDEIEVSNAVETALEKGYRHIDTAFVYNNEKAIGKVVNRFISEGKLKREDLFITTKLPLTGVHPDRVELFMKKSLENLQLDYVDLYLIHFPIGMPYDPNLESYIKDDEGNFVLEPKTDHAAVWKAMEKLVDAGLTKNIGLSNYNQAQITEILKSARIKPANLQVELNVLLQQRDLVNFCFKNGISVVAYCPLSNPNYNKYLEKMGRPTKEQYDLLGNSVVQQIAKKHSKTTAQVALRFLLQIGVAAIPKSVTSKRIQENFEVFDFVLSEDEMNHLRALEVGEKARLADFAMHPNIKSHPDYPFPKNV